MPSTSTWATLRAVLRLAVLAMSTLAPVAAAAPFVIDLTIQGAHGWISATPPATANTPFTAPYIVVRVTGDTDNVIATYPDYTVYQGSTFGISIPGVGSGSQPTQNIAVSVSVGSLDFVMPSYPSVYSSGASARDPALEDKVLRALGPIPLQDASTYHWGPTSAMIGFTTDDGRGVSVAAGYDGPRGGTLEVRIGGSASNPIAATTYRDLPAFLAASGPAKLATFEEGSGALSGGVSFPGGLLKVVESLPVFRFPGGYLPEAETFWFGNSASPKHFALVEGASAWFEAEFPADVVAAGFAFNCFECDSGRDQSAIVWTTQDAAGNTLDYGTAYVDLQAPAQGTARPPGFFGVTTTKPFRRLTVTKTYFVLPWHSWVIDDVRFAVAAGNGAPAPTAAIPALDDAGLLASALMLAAAAALALRRRARR